MPRKKIRINPKGKGFVQKITNPLEKAHGDVSGLVDHMKNPPKQIRKFWPPNLLK